MLSLLLTILFTPAFPSTASEAPCWIEDAGATGSQVWLMCDQKRVFISSDAGASWRESMLPSDVRLRSIEVVDSRRAFVVGDMGTLLASRDGGERWHAIPVPTKEHLRDIHFRGEQGWIAGYGGVVLHSSDGGRTWSQQSTGTSISLDGIFFADAQHGWAVGWNGTILRTTDGGRRWDSIRSPAAMWSLTSIHFEDGRSGWIAGMLGQLLRTRDGGLTWEAQQVPTRATLNAVHFDQQGKGWIAGENAILTSSDGGQSWQAQEFGNWVFLEKILPVNGSLWAVGPFGILRRSDPEAKWTSLSLPRQPQRSGSQS